LHGTGSVLWDSLRLGGFPDYIGQYGGLQDPLNLFLFKNLSFFNAYHWRIVFDVVLAFSLMYVFLWRLVKSRTGAFLDSSTAAVFGALTFVHVGCYLADER